MHLRVPVHACTAIVSLLASCASPSAAIDLRAIRPHRPSAATRLELPPLGRVQGDRLVDGDPVWVVRTIDDQVHVLAADARVELAGRVERVLVAYDPDCSCFRGMAPVVWGLDGAISARTQPDYDRYFPATPLGIRRPFDDATVYRLDRYALTRDGDAIEVGARWRATEHVTREDRLAAMVLDVRGPDTECAIAMAPSSLSDALTQPEGRTVLVNARIVREGRSSRLCGPDGGATCGESAPRIYDHDGWTTERTWIVPGPVVARRFGDGFVNVSSADICARLEARCAAPAHDAAWLRTPVGASEGITIDAPVACEERPAPEVRMIRVHGHGARALSSHASEIPDACSSPGSDPGACPVVPAVAFHQALFDALHRHGHLSFGIGACFESGRPTEGRLAAVAHDWRHADAAIRIVSDELARWDLRDTFWVSLEPMMCGHLLGAN